MDTKDSSRKDIVIKAQPSEKSHDSASTSIDNVPTEIMIEIFKVLLQGDGDLVTATCLGLTSRKFWTILRDLHPQLIRIDTNYTVMVGTKPKDTYMLLEQLRDWMGSKYRIESNLALLHHDGFRGCFEAQKEFQAILPFLPCSIYGTDTHPNTAKECHLTLRYDIYSQFERQRKLVYVSDKPEYYANPFRTDANTWWLAAARKWLRDLKWNAGASDQGPYSEEVYSSMMTSNSWIRYKKSALRKWVIEHSGVDQSSQSINPSMLGGPSGADSYEKRMLETEVEFRMLLDFVSGQEQASEEGKVQSGTPKFLTKLFFIQR